VLTSRLLGRLGDGVDPSDVRAVMSWVGEHSGFAAQTGRIGLPDQIATLVAYLASPANGYVTGAHVNADGGSLFGP
jgi:NAD(P)-dependent dehydrogenase (short-subunit alcohol dehydrogenase family)